MLETRKKILTYMMVKLLQYFGLLHYIEAIISDAAAQSSECPQLYCSSPPHPTPSPINEKNK